jgi:NAD(P)-dependent dehydrogenase (short-subunit alcohol dehydrogenase family)
VAPAASGSHSSKRSPRTVRALQSWTSTAVQLSANRSALAAAYPAAKAGTAALMRNAALELARYNILVNAIAPGPFVTNIGGGHLQNPEWQRLAAQIIPLHRVGRTHEMKGLALLLASPASSFMTGAEIFNDGGLAIGPPID